MQEILVHVRQADERAAGVRIALDLAERFGARATGLYVVPMVPAAFVAPEAVAIQGQFMARELDEARGRADWWREACAKHGVDGEWQALEGDPIDVIAHCASLADLVVMERPQSDPSAPVGFGTVTRSLFAGASPMLVVPDVCQVSTPGRRVLIAWNGAREAARAVRAALPLLQRAEAVRVLVGARRDEGLPMAPPALALRPWLERRGITADYVDFTPAGKVGSAMLEAASAYEADMIVMGAWGRSRLAELALGGTTRYLFQNSGLPLLVAH